MSQSITDFLNRGKRTKIPTGIHQNIELTKVELAEENNSTNYFIDFHFSDNQGLVHNNRLWLPTYKEWEGKDKQYNDDYFSHVKTRTIESIAQYLEIFLTPEELKEFKVDLNDLKSFYKRTYAILQSRLKTQKLNIVLIHTKDGLYSEFPKYAPYVEKFVEGENSKLKIPKKGIERALKAAQQKEQLENKPKNTGSSSGPSLFE